MRTSRGAWSLAGLVAGAAGLATSYCVAMVMTIRDSPVVAVAEQIIRLVPGGVIEKAIRLFGPLDKPLLVLGVIAGLVAVFTWTGRLARRSWWRPVVVYAVLAAIGAVAVLAQRGAGPVDLLPVAVGLGTWVVALIVLAEPLRRAELVAAEAADRPAGEGGDLDSLHRHTRRGFVLRAGLLTALGAAVAVFGRSVGVGRRAVEKSRRLLKLDGVTEGQVPPGARVDLEGISPWRTPNDDFYLIHTALVVPAIEPADWTLRITGMVDRPLEITYAQLVAREITQSWVTLTCVSNEVGGGLVGNAWWSGVRIADLLAEAGVQEGADAVKQTSDDGWTCGTPLEALTDDRGAMLAVAMNGRPLPVEHGFPVRTVVPGLYGYVSATKWVRELEVTRFEDFEAYWTTKGWGERGPIKMASRIDVPRQDAEVPAGTVRFGGVAWAQTTGVAEVEVAVDGGPWLPAEVADPGTNDTWVQWVAQADVAEGDHVVRVRMTDKDGAVQTGVEADVVPDGATGWHERSFRAVEA
ncbi:molybdopterin-dependent oxidoreductase [Nocardioides marmotae]|uniref:molybdopterin-dependent oxidoreductase n=1 Tax=Nocardioides marmotae TaxID=2663857 RepID=UPI001322DDB7|nr:molybdopterin-dependent oxidoreductase [Nocardioides marmotae]MTB85918.1 molybdopterin-dependent oxidoreductase [Nocardioides marmotae]